jgi:hypothetical protein
VERSVTAGAGTEDTEDTEDVEFVSYREFGEQFFSHVVTEERVLAAVNMLAGQPIDVGPLGVGPGRLVKLTARGAIGGASGRPLPDPEVVAFQMSLPVDLHFRVDLGLETQRFNAALTVPLVLSARAVQGLKVYIDVTPPRSREIGIHLRADGMRASVLQRVADVEGEVRRFVARYVARELDKPYVRAALLIDVGAQVDRAWQKISPHVPSPTAEHIGGDLRDAIRDEITGSGSQTGQDAPTDTAARGSA